jgi:hypothetical protein
MRRIDFLTKTAKFGGTIFGFYYVLTNNLAT